MARVPKVNASSLSSWLVSSTALLGVLIGCSPELAAPNELASLRVLGVKKDDPFARPGSMPAADTLGGDAADGSTGSYQPDNVVDMTLAWEDSRRPSEQTGPIERRWFAGCDNPRLDNYFSCLLNVWLTFRAHEELGEGELQVGEKWSLAEADSAAKQDFIASVAPEIPAAIVSAYLPKLDGLKMASGDQFSLSVSPSLIADHQPPSDPDTAPYGISYVFFTVCDGRLGLAPDWQGDIALTEVLTDATRGFPLTCYDRDTNEERGPDHFVAGYSQVYAFEELANRNPVVGGFEIDGHAVRRQDLCIGEACRHDAEGLAEGGDVCDDPESLHVKRCRGEGGSGCPSLEVSVVVDEKNNSEPDVGARTGGESLLEQMWIRYYTDQGELANVVRRLQDANEGWFNDHETKWKVPRSPGQALLWAVVYDNRGGLDWVRARVCVE